MAYSLYIKRDSPITVDEWLSAVDTIENLRIDESDTVGVNPKTGAEIRIPGRTKKEVALWFPESEEWIKVFFFWRGKILLKPNDWDNPKSPVRNKAFELARKLNAEIVGDNGEIYTN
jgi:hypothetical protein